MIRERSERDAESGVITPGGHGRGRYETGGARVHLGWSPVRV